jgi:DNA-binding transcriptional MerR regulator
MADMGIGRLTELTGVKIPTIRFYEQNGILAAP